jgi:hypothetical protein
LFWRKQPSVWMIRNYNEATARYFIYAVAPEAEGDGHIDCEPLYLRNFRVSAYTCLLTAPRLIGYTSKESNYRNIRQFLA